MIPPCGAPPGTGTKVNSRTSSGAVVVRSRVSIVSPGSVPGVQLIPNWIGPLPSTVCSVPAVLIGLTSPTTSAPRDRLRRGLACARAPGGPVAPRGPVFVLDFSAPWAQCIGCSDATSSRWMLLSSDRAEATRADAKPEQQGGRACRHAPIAAT